MKITCIIPARFGSKRFPGKVLVDIAGKPMIQRVYEQASGSALVNRVIVAADDKRIVEAVKKFRGESVLTPECGSGTDRVALAAADIETDIVVNVQGDEPLMPPESIDRTIKLLVDDGSVEMATAAVPIDKPGRLKDNNIVKVVLDRDSFAIYFSRSIIPAVRDGRDNGFGFLKHVGIYVYRKEFLKEFVKMQPGPLENAERLEQLRVLENGRRIKVAVTERDSISVDTEEDLKRIEEELEKREILP